MKNDDRSKSLIVFGLEEEENEEVDHEITRMLQNFCTVMPVVRERYRVGPRKPGTDRPVRVSFNSSEAAAEVLRESKGLKQSKDYKKVFITPDRTPEERAERKKLVVLLKKKIEAEPKLYHFIRSGTICSVAKTPTP